MAGVSSRRFARLGDEADAIAESCDCCVGAVVTERPQVLFGALIASLFDPDFSVGRDLLAMLSFVMLALAVACRRFSQAPVFESLARVFMAPKRN